MRILSGKWRGKLLSSFTGEHIRPTTDRIKESMFNILENNPNIALNFNGLSILDAFAGTGSLGIEALSRNAKHATFIENNPLSLKTLHKNLSFIAKERYSLKPINTLNLQHSKHSVDVIFLDPPYQDNLITQTITTLHKHNWINHKTIITVEADITYKPHIPDNFKIIHQKQYGKSILIFTKLNESQNS